MSTVSILFLALERQDKTDLAMAANEAGGISHYPLAPGWSPSPCLGAIVKVEQPPPPANCTATPLMMTEEDQSEIIYYLEDSEIQLMISRLHEYTVLQASAVVVSWLKMSGMTSSELTARLPACFVSALSSHFLQFQLSQRLSPSHADYPASSHLSEIYSFLSTCNINETCPLLLIGLFALIIINFKKNTGLGTILQFKLFVCLFATVVIDLWGRIQCEVRAASYVRPWDGTYCTTTAHQGKAVPTDMAVFLAILIQDLVVDLLVCVDRSALS